MSTFDQKKLLDTAAGRVGKASLATHSEQTIQNQLDEAAEQFDYLKANYTNPDDWTTVISVIGDIEQTLADLEHVDPD
jgi:hypothetical protein